MLHSPISRFADWHEERISSSIVVIELGITRRSNVELNINSCWEIPLFRIFGNLVLFSSDILIVMDYGVLWYLWSIRCNLIGFRHPCTSSHPPVTAPVTEPHLRHGWRTCRHRVVGHVRFHQATPKTKRVQRKPLDGKR